MAKKSQSIINSVRQNERLTSGVPGLDTLLKGGFIKGGAYLLLGPPGSGKTILGNQICFHHAKSGAGNVVYVTLLAESHYRMMGSLQGLDYFESDLVAHSIHYFSGYATLEKDGLNGLLLQIAGLVRKHKATLLVIDGVTTIGEMDQSRLAFRKFVHELNSFIAASNCTAFLLSSGDGVHAQPEHTMVDGIVVLFHQKVSIRSNRLIEIRKFRGSNHLQGEHLFKISEHGVRIYPRAETLKVEPRPTANPAQRLSFDIPALDEMLGGGLISNSVTTIIGPTGTGKTILGLQFLRAGVEAKEPCLFFGFYETPADLLDKAFQLGFALDKWVKQGLLTLQWIPALEEELDELGETLIESIRKTGAKRVVIDALDGFRNSTSDAKRVNLFLVALLIKIKSLGVTVIIIEETSLYLNHSERKVTELSAMNENIIYLRHVEIESRLTRVVSILKIRSAVYDPSVRELRISAAGIDVLAAVRRAEGFTSHEIAETDAVLSRKPQASKKGRRK